MVTMPAKKPIVAKTFPAKVGKRLRELREAAGVSVEAMAKACGVGVKAVYHWERGERDIPFKAFPKLKKLFKLDSERDLLPE